MSSIGLGLTVVLLLAAGWALRRASAAEHRRELDVQRDGGALPRPTRAVRGADRAAVVRAVRTGTRCADPDLAPAAADRAQRGLASLYSPWARTGWGLLVASQACNAAWIGLRSGGDLAWAGPGLGAVLLAAAVGWWAWWAPHRCYQARRALALNRHGTGAAESDTAESAAEAEDAAEPPAERDEPAAGGAEPGPEREERLGTGPDAG
ncbi:hypothetical protein [Murinocardiopsis flavida]|uniref:hypothetical protein n=1 Tax=Murinocardiopsis flavida TaxID=645275 RepID=UPI0011B1E76B|nr:hypothetical protein [Murinocardiopsis flavida]